MEHDPILARMDASLARIDRHMERGNELMERIDRHMERGDKLMERIDRHVEEASEEIRLSRQSRDDLRGFIRDQNTRMERVLDRVTERLADMGEQIQANTRAVLAALDHLEGGRA